MNIPRSVSVKEWLGNELLDNIEDAVGTVGTGFTETTHKTNTHKHILHNVCL